MGSAGLPVESGAWGITVGLERRMMQNSSRTMMRFLPVVILLVLVLSGCQKQGETVSEGTEGPSAQADSSNTSTNGSGPATGDLDNTEIPVPPSWNTEGVRGPGEAEGYEPADGQEVLTLGEQVDLAFNASEPMLGSCRMEIDNAGARTQALPRIKLQDPDNFLIEYVDVERQQDMGRLVSRDGESRIRKESTFVEPNLSAVPQRFDRDEIEDWMADFPLRMFDGFREEKPYWSKLIPALKDPANGFKTTVEEKISEITYPDKDGNMISDNDPRKFYRIAAISEDGTSEIEIIIDSKRYVPVTILTTKKLEGDKERKILWNASWGYGGSFTSEDFQFPGS